MLLGKPESLIPSAENRPGHHRWCAIDSSKISGELGWSPRHTFEKGLERTVEWYRTEKPLGWSAAAPAPTVTTIVATTMNGQRWSKSKEGGNRSALFLK